MAAGALSSIASSAWQGGTTNTEGFSQENNWAWGTKTISHAGLGTGTGTFGLVAFGTLAGAGGAALTGGNVWLGAATGFVVSFANHAAHADGHIDPIARICANYVISSIARKCFPDRSDMCKLCQRLDSADLQPDRSDMCKLCHQFDSAELHSVPANNGKTLVEFI